jgi:hypothetical protein
MTARMLGITTLLPFVLPLLLPYLGAVIMWSRRSLLVYGILLGLPLAAIWLTEWRESYSTDYNPGSGVAIGLLLLGSLTVGLVGGIVVRAFTLWRLRKSPNVRAAAFHSAGFALLTAGSIAMFAIGT